MNEKKRDESEQIEHTRKTHDQNKQLLSKEIKKKIRAQEKYFELGK